MRHGFRCFEPMFVSREFNIESLLTSSLVRVVKGAFADTHLLEQVQKH